MSMNLNQRQKQLILFLLKHSGYVPVKRVAEEHLVSEKTIYRDINFINKELAGYESAIQVKSGSGIRMSLNEDKRNLLLYDIRQNDSSSSIEFRRKDILLHLLRISPEPVSINRLSEMYFVGQTSIVNDLKEVELQIEGSGLRMTRDSKGTRISGNEYDVRRKINELYSELLQDTNYSGVINPESYHQLCIKFEPELIHNVEEMLSEIESKLNIQIVDPYFINIVTHVLIAIERIKSGNYIDDLSLNVDTVNTTVYGIVKQTVGQLSERIQVEFPITEITYIYLHVISSGVKASELLDQDRSAHDVTDFYHEVLQAFEKVFCINNLTDDILQNYLLLHLRSMLDRGKYRIQVICPNKEEMMSEYAELFLRVKTILLDLLQKFFPGIEISDDEICYIVMYLLAFREKSAKVPNMLVVCSTGVGTSHLLKRRIEKNFPEWNIVDMLSLNSLKTYDLSNIDIILSTIRLQEGLAGKIPVAYVSPLFSKEDIDMVKKMLASNDRNGV